MAAPTIPNGEEHFFPILYEGTGTGRRVGKFVPFTNNGTIANSCMFDSTDSADRLMATIGTSSTANARRKMTLSFWYKWTGSGTNYQTIWTVGGDGQTPYIAAYINNNGSRPKGSITFFDYTGSGSSYNSMIDTKRGFADPSKWYHVLFAMDTTQSTASDRLKIYVDGELQETDTNNYYSQDFDTGFGTNVAYAYGTNKTVSSGGYWFDGYLAEINHVDGTALTPSTFGVTDTSTGRWIPKTLTGITYGDNGHRLKFQDSSALGDDTSGNGNDFTATDLASANQTTDSPTQNFITFGSGDRFLGTQQTTEQGGMTIYASIGTGYTAVSAGKEIPQSGKWYWEVKLQQVGNVVGLQNGTYGVIDRNLKEINNFSTSNEIGQQVGGMGGTFWSGFKFGGLLSTGTDFTIGSYQAANNDYVLFAFDMDNGKAWWGFNDSSAGSSVVWFANDGGIDGNPSTGANPTVTFTPSNHRFVPIQQFYAPGGSDGAGGTYASRWNFNFGSKAFAFTAPTGFNGLSQNNFPATDKGISGLVWMKNRDATDSHQLYDSSRGEHKDLQSDANNAESTTTDGLQKFLKGGQAIEDDVSINTSGESYVSWNWVANGGTTASNGTGSITSTVQANTTAGFSIVQFTGTGGAATVGHGLSSTPEWIVCKNLEDTASWAVYHKDMTSTSYTLFLDTNAAETSSSTMWNATAPTSSIINVGANYASNGSSQKMVHYCWHSVDGFSKFGKYKGNGDADGTFVYTGFKPAWIMIKETGNTNDWMIWDNKRFPLNPTNNSLFADLNQGDNGSSIDLDVLSNGFKCRTNNSQINRSNGSYVYMAFAEHPFVGDGTSPVTAR